MNTGIRLRSLPGTPGPTRPQRPLDVRIRQAAINSAAVIVIVVAAVAAVTIGYLTSWAALSALAGFVAGR